MRQRAALMGMALLSACGRSVESVQPLFTGGTDTLKPGLWASVPIDKPCQLPRGAAIFEWPDCAAPILIRDGSATYFKPAPVRIAFVLADGTPRIIQTETDILDGLGGADATRPSPPGQRFYASLYPEGAAPFTAGKIQFLLCPPSEVEPVEQKPRRKQQGATLPERGAIPGLRSVEIDNKTHCLADTPAAVHELAERVPPGDGLRIAWIAAYP